jgi:hypothetical protein
MVAAAIRTCMTVEIHIGGKLIESVPAELDKCSCYEDRKGKIFKIESHLKWKYRESIILKENWEIIAVAQSKMNKPTKT